MKTEEDRYAIENAIDKINGYYFPNANEKTFDTFNRAKLEAIRNLKKEIINIENVTWEMFFIKEWNNAIPFL